MTDTLPTIDAHHAALLLMNYQVFVLADASADPQADVHEFLTERIFPRQAHVITTAQLKGLLCGG